MYINYLYYYVLCPAQCSHFIIIIIIIVILTIIIIIIIIIITIVIITRFDCTYLHKSIVLWSNFHKELLQILTYRKILPIIDRKAETTKSSSAIFHVHRQQRKAGISQRDGGSERLLGNLRRTQLKKTGPTN